MTEMTRKEREAARNRQEILEAAEEVFAEKGYVSASMEDVAKRAEFSVGALYKFFKNKEDLYAEILRKKVAVMEASSSAVFAKELPPVEMIRELYATRVELFWANRRFFRLFFHQTMGTVCDIRAGFTPDIQERYHAFRNRLTEIFAHGIRSRQFRDIDPDVMTHLFEGSVRSYLARLSQLPDAKRNKKEEEQVLGIFLEGALRQSVAQPVKKAATAPRNRKAAK